MNYDDTLLTAEKEPPVVLDAAFVDQLQGLATSALHRNPDVANRLLREIERATVVASAEIPRNVVNLGSTVSFRDDSEGQIRTVTLVLPSQADIARRQVSVLTPIGAALIGLSEGASISWETLTGETRRLTIMEIGGTDAA